MLLWRSSMQPRCRSVTRWTMRDIVSTRVTRVVQCWDGMKRESFVWEGIQRCRSSQTRTLTTCFNGSLSMTRTTWHRTDLSGLTLVVWTVLSTGTGSTDNRQVHVMIANWSIELNWLNRSSRILSRLVAKQECICHCRVFCLVDYMYVS